MTRNLRLLTLSAVALAGLSIPAHAGVSLDRTSPSVGGACPFLVNPGNLYRFVMPPLGGCDVAGVGPVTEVMDASLGLLGGDNIDAVSANTVTGKNIPYHIYFSGDRASLGLLGTPYRGEAALNQAASDVWRTNNATTVSPLAAMGACAAAGIPGFAPALFRNQDLYDFIFTAAPGAGPLVGNQDNLDGLELDDLDFMVVDQIHDADVYFSLDAGSPSLGAGSPADIYYAPAGGAFGPWAVPAQLGLVPGDDIDGLVVWERGAVGVSTAGVDLVLFSLTPGSPSLGAASAATLFVSDLTGAFCPFVLANTLGLRGVDNVDGIDILP